MVGLVINVAVSWLCRHDGVKLSIFGLDGTSSSLTRTLALQGSTHLRPHSVTMGL